MPEKRVYGIRDAKGVSRILSEPEYKKEYARRLENNMFYTGTDPKGIAPGQQPRVQHNKGEGLYLEITPEETTNKGTQAQPIIAQPTVAQPIIAQPTANLMDKNFKTRESVWNEK